MNRETISKITNIKLFIIFELVLITINEIMEVIPFSTIILFVWASFLLWAKKSNWKKAGLAKLEKVWLTIFIAMIFGFGLQLFNIFYFEPIVGKLLNSPIDVSRGEFLEGNLLNALAMIPIIWIIAAFGEEMVYRGYLLNRIVNLFGGTKLAWAFGIIFSSIIFGYFGHIYAGPVGAIEAVYVAILTCFMYLFSKKNLWLPILFHGFYDMMSIAIVYLGIYPQ